MAFSIIVQNGSGEEIERSWRLGNERYLMQEEEEFPLLGNLNLASYDVFSSVQAEALRLELLALKGRVENQFDRSHLDRLAQLVQMASEIEGGTIIFTPFSR